MISILLAAYKSEEILKKVFIPGLLNMKDEVEVIIYDNGGNGDALSEKPPFFLYDYGVTVIGDGKNIGLNAALNECAKVAKGDWFYLPHTDMYLMPGWDKALLKVVENHPPKSLLLCSRSIEPTKGHTDYHIIKNYGMEHHEFEEEKLLQDFENYSDSTVVSGYRMPFFLHRTLWEKMDGVDPNYFSYCTDDDLVQEAYDSGVRRFWMVYDSLVYHLQGKSNIQQSVDRDSQEPYRYFVEKWRKRGYLDARHPGHWHPQLIPWYKEIR
jgi:GT2 family glycosyltransferase